MEAGTRGAQVGGVGTRLLPLPPPHKNPPDSTGLAARRQRFLPPLSGWRCRTARQKPSSGVVLNCSFPQEPVHVVGCVACDGQGRLNSKSIVLEGGRGGYGEGQQVELDVSQVKDVGLFTGQVRRACALRYT